MNSIRADQVEHRALDGDLQGRGDLAGGRRLGARAQCPGDRHPLAPATGQLTRVAPGQRDGQRHQRQ
ncbi:hypothetical protein ACFQVD_05055 [Streptosporangium amethystogenes subsp. fukuiense]|uniref:Uncharacterized protein n=1 Tax=Streptosporangium amethystogenes subsp. fukuiense TaxID=698418 RepID=A0ABW2ST62_9ACTN